MGNSGYSGITDLGLRARITSHQFIISLLWLLRSPLPRSPRSPQISPEHRYEWYATATCCNRFRNSCSIVSLCSTINLSYLSSNINMFPEVLAAIASVVGGAGAGAALGTVPLSAAMPSCEVFQCYVICYGQDMARLVGGMRKGPMMCQMSTLGCWKQVSACLNSFGDAEGPLLGDFWLAPGGSEITDNWATFKVFQICQNDQNGSVGSLVRKSCCFSEVYNNFIYIIST